MERPLDAMGRPKKAAQASKANGATAKNKGKAVDVKKELFGGYSPGGSYTIKTIAVRRTMAKGEVRQRKLGCEHDVYTFCLYHGTFARFDDGDAGDKQGKKRMYPGGVDAERWDAATKRAALMLEQSAELDPKAKMAQLRRRTKGAKVRIKFGR